METLSKKISNGLERPVKVLQFGEGKFFTCIRRLYD